MTLKTEEGKFKNVQWEVEMLNRTCLDLVAEIEKLKRENARLRCLAGNYTAPQKTRNPGN